jgi:general secretion pathway protein C
MMAALAFVLAAEVATPPPDLIAVGLVIATSGERSVAILRSGGRTRVAGVGEPAFGGRITAIVPGSAQLEFGSERITVRLSGEPAARATPLPPRAEVRPPSASEAPTFERKEVERRLGLEIPRILAETTLVPVLDGGRITGVALTRIAEGSVLTEAGLRAGDVLAEVNGVAIDGIATLAGLYARLQSTSELRAIVVRNGQRIPIAINLR